MSTVDADGYGGGKRAKNDVGLDIDEVHSVIRDIPKPVIAADTAKFGQVGPKVAASIPGSEPPT